MSAKPAPFWPVQLVLCAVGAAAIQLGFREFGASWDWWAFLGTQAALWAFAALLPRA